MTYEIAHEGVDDVAIERDGHGGIPLNDIAMIGTLLFLMAFLRLTGKESSA